MKRIVLGAVAAVFAFVAARSEAEPATVPTSQTVASAPAAVAFDTFHDVPTGFVFVRLPQGWRFVGQDHAVLSHAVFHDEPTGFTYVKVDGRWRFAGVAAEAAADRALAAAPGVKVVATAR